MPRSIPILLFFVICCGQFALAEGTLSQQHHIDSEQLGYTLQYQVYVPAGSKAGDQLPSLYLTDGHWFIDKLSMVTTLNQQIETGNIKPLIVVFVDSRDPHRLSNNRRQTEFFCNSKYASFYVEELIPQVSRQYAVSLNRAERVIAGISYGGINAACFGLMASQTFSGIGILSPSAESQVNYIARQYKQHKIKPLSFFLSNGEYRDYAKQTQKLHQILKEKGYKVNYVEVPFTHDWANWRTLTDDLLLTFFGKKSL